MEKKLAEMAAALKAKRFGLDKVKGAGDMVQIQAFFNALEAKYKEASLRRLMRVSFAIFLQALANFVLLTRVWARLLCVSAYICASVYLSMRLCVFHLCALLFLCPFLCARSSYPFTNTSAPKEEGNKWQFL